MKIKSNISFLLFLFVANASAERDSTDSYHNYHKPTSTYQVGTWTSDITPKPSEALNSCLGGYGGPFSRCGSAEVLDPITVRALSISDHDTTAIFAVIDTIATGDSLIRDIKDLAFELTDGAIQPESIQVVATHTHAGPDMQGLWGGISADYRQRIVNTAALSIILANYNAVEAEINALVIEDGANVTNRRGWDEVDKDIAVLDIKSKRHHRRIATLVNMSAHPTILDASNMAYSSGYIHFIRKRIEKRLGGNAIFINGRLGDASAVRDGSSYQDVRKYGRGVARKVIKNIRHARPVSGDFSFNTHAFSHPITNLPIIGAAQAGLIDIEIDENLNINTQFSIMEFGNDVSAVLFPGEILTRLATPIISALNGRSKFFFGLTDDSLGYFIPSDEYLMIEGRNTEETASMDINAGDAIQAAILSALSFY